MMFAKQAHGPAAASALSAVYGGMGAGNSRSLLLSSAAAISALVASNAAKVSSIQYLSSF